MALQFTKISVLACVLGLCIGLGSGGGAIAASYTFNFTGNVGDLSITQETPAQVGDLPLIDAQSGLNQTPDFELTAGDNVSGTVKLNTSLKVPGSGSIVDIDLFNLQIFPSDTVINDVISLTFFNKSVEIAPPMGFKIATGSVGGFILGGYDFTPPIDSFSFDEIVFSANITSVNKDGAGPISSVDILPGSPSLQYLVFPPFAASAPEPATWAMMILGFGFIGLGIRARRLLTS